ncbi:uncharacterized protein LOC114295372 [Camellia sinensis]|uniref:uncharacterized protein LOC114295372 n=1 Tax=Camellia sinensis TaxID=4442 RepID=UPI0010356607|nr:uncharacterized protein LOC114295372 [Camellia sinensis]
MEYFFPDGDILQIEEKTWMMYFGGAANQYGYAIGVLLITPDDSYIPLAFKLRFKVSNSEAEYEACITGLEVVLKLEEKRLDIIGDSNLVVFQANGDWRFTHLLRENNRYADVLATLSSMVDIPLGVRIRPIIIEQKYTLAYETIVAIDKASDKNPWCYDTLNFLEMEAYPPRATVKDKRGIRCLAVQFIICGDMLYKRSHLRMHKLCVEEENSKRLVEAIHRGDAEPT